MLGRRFLTLIVGLAQLKSGAVGQTLPGPDNPYIAPQSSLSPCPGLNALANHGYIPRDGRDVLLADILDAAVVVYGLERFSLSQLVLLFFQQRGLPFSNSPTGDAVIQLSDLYGSGYDASLIHRDDFFETMAQPNAELLTALQEAAGDDGILNTTELADFRESRIIDSRQTNPDFEISFGGTLSDFSLMGGKSGQVFLFDTDPTFETVSMANAISFIREGRIPDGFVPREPGSVSATADPIMREVVTFFVARQTEALEADLSSQAPTMSLTNETTSVPTLSPTNSTSPPTVLPTPSPTNDALTESISPSSVPTNTTDIVTDLPTMMPTNMPQNMTSDIDDFPGPEYVYVAPGPTDMRSPCPALNTLANHGFIPRNGQNIPVDVMDAAMIEVFGLDDALEITFILEQFGLPLMEDANGTVHMVSLFDLYAFGHDASLVRQDDYFEQNAGIDQELVDALAQTAGEDGVLTQEELADFRDSRILHSRYNNPDFSFTTEGPAGNLAATALESASVFAFGGDPAFAVVPIENIISFLGLNRIPEGFMPRIQQGQNATSQLGDPLFLSVQGYFANRTVESLTADLTTAPSLAPADASLPTAVPMTESPTASGSALIPALFRTTVTGMVVLAVTCLL